MKNEAMLIYGFSYSLISDMTQLFGISKVKADLIEEVCNVS